MSTWDNREGKPVFFVARKDDLENLLALKAHIKADNMAQVVRYCIRYTAEQLLKSEAQHE